MLAILLSFIIGTFTFLAIGDLFILVFNKVVKEKSDYNLVDTILLGIVFTSSIIAVNSIWFPSDSFTLIILLLIACIYSVLQRKRLAGYAKYYREKLSSMPTGILFLIVVIPIVVLMMHGLSAPVWVDSPYYHYQNIMWNEQYSVVPGLANLQTRFGFNSDHYLLCAVFGLRPVFGQYIFNIQLICLAYIFVWILYKSYYSNSIQKTVIPITMYICFIVIYKLHISSPSSDLLPNLLILYLFIKIIYDKNAIIKNQLIFFCIPVFCLTLKLSAFPVCLFCIYIIWQLVRNKKYTALGMLVVYGLIILVPWCIRTVILTGYLIYPFSTIDIFSFDWKVPLEYVTEQKDYIRDFAHGMTDPTKEETFRNRSSSWIPIWWQSGMFYYTPYANRFFFIASIASIIIMPFLWITTRKKRAEYSYLLYVWLIAFVGFIFWFISAPDFRFGYGFILSLVFIVVFLSLILINRRPENEKRFIQTFIILSVVFISLHTIRWVYYQRDMEQPVYRLLYKPVSIAYIKKHKEKIAKRPIKFNEIEYNNIIIYQADYETHCYDCELPCSSDYTGGIQMRGESIKDGFRTEDGFPHRKGY